MKRYVVRTRFVFDGEFFVTAENKAEARERVKDDCGLVMGGSIHTTLPDDEVDWKFDMHPDKQIVNIHSQRKGGKRANRKTA